MFSILKISEDSIHLTVSSLQKLILFTLLTRVSWKIKLGKLHIDQKCFVTEAATRSVPCKTVFLEACNFIKKETLAQVFSCEFCEVSKNTFLQNTFGRLMCLQVARICWGVAIVWFTVLFFKRSVKEHCVAKVLLAIWETFLYENNCNFNSYRFSYKLAFISFLFFRIKQKRKIIF